MQLKLDVVRQDGVGIVHCHGRVVFGQEVDELRLTILSLLKQSNRIVLELSGIDQIDSEGLAALVGLFISARNRDGEIKLAALSAKSRDLLRITRLDKVFETYDTVAQALQSFPPPSEAVHAG